MELEPWLPFVFLTLYVLLALVRSAHAVAARRSISSSASGPAPTGTGTSYDGALGTTVRYALAIGLAVSVTLYGFFHTFAVFGWLGRFEIPLPAWSRIASVPVTLGGIALLHWSHRTLGQFFSVKLEFQERHEVVKGGPYAYVRHPMYSAFILFFLASSMVAANALVAFFAFGLVVYILARIPSEERMMRGRFSAEYEAYAKKTGRLLPKLGS